MCRRLDHLPVYGIGVSAGAAFLLKMPRYMKVGGIPSCWHQLQPAAEVLKSPGAARSEGCRCCMQRPRLRWAGRGAGARSSGPSAAPFRAV